MPELNYTDPINRDHPLGNKIAQGNWWKVLPQGHPRGLAWRDLCGKNDGKLTGGASWNYSRSPYSRFGSVSVAGASQEVLFGTPSWLAGATKATIACWIYRASTGDTVSVGVRSTGTQGDRLGFIWYSDGNIYFQVENGSGSFPNCALAGTGWHHVVMVYDGSLSGLARLAVHVDGVPRSLSAGGFDPPTSLVSDPEQFGFGRDQNARWSTGSADEIMLSPYAWTSIEAQQVYHAVLQEYSSLLNWDHDDWWLAQPQAAAGSSFVDPLVGGGLVSGGLFSGGLAG